MLDRKPFQKRFDRKLQSEARLTGAMGVFDISWTLRRCASKPVSCKPDRSGEKKTFGEMKNFWPSVLIILIRIFG